MLTGGMHWTLKDSFLGEAVKSERVVVEIDSKFVANALNSCNIDVSKFGAIISTTTIVPEVWFVQ